jgi:ankyrin repeat protein
MGSADSVSDDFEIIDRQEAALGPEDLAKIHKWLQPTDYDAESSEFHRHLASQAPETGLWICNTPRFRQWHDSDEHGSLWIKGVPGAGKSVIAASMVKYLRGADNIPVIFFFFRYIIAANRKPRGLVRDWLAQLLPYSSRLQAALQPLISGDIDDVSEEQLWEHLLTGLASIQKAYCVVDALDEMEMEVGLSDKFLRRLNALATFRPNFIKLLMTSRPKEYLQRSLKDTSIVHIDLESDLVGKDIATFVSHRLRIALPGNDQKDLLDSLARTVSSRSRGLFLYARLLLDQIIPTLVHLKYEDIKTLASTLPIGLEDMYNSMLFQQCKLFRHSNIPDLGAQLQVFLLECVTHASRLLRLNELASIVDLVLLPSVGLNTSSTPGWNSKQAVRSACIPLLEILDDGTVQVIHHSFTEFLLDTERVSSKGKNVQFPILDSYQAHRNLALTCLKYLQSGGLRVQDDGCPKKMVTICDGACDHGDWPCRKHPIEEDVYQYQEQKLIYPFLDYAVTNWAFHTSHYDVEDIGFFKAVSQFLNPSSVDYQRWLLLQWGIRWPFSEKKSPDALHIASFAGMTKFATTLIREGHSVDALDGDQMTPLHWASKRGHSKMVSLLLLEGANPDLDDRRGNKPLLLAAKQNHAVVVQLLLQAGVDPCTFKTRENHTGRIKGGETTTKGETAVEYVSKNGHTETILVMLPFLKSESLEEVLCSCARFKKFEAVRAVLENSHVSANAKFEGGTALYLAVRAKCVRSVELLLAKGADPNLTSEWEPRPFHRFGRCRKEDPRTPLHALALTWPNSESVACQSILRLLLQAGADLEAKETLYGATPLLLLFPPRMSGSNALFSGSAMKSFLEAGADANADCKAHYNYSKSHPTNNVLQRFLDTSNNLELLKMLLDRGARIDIQYGSGDTPLHLVLSSSMTKRWGNGEGSTSIDEVVKFFLDNGAPCNLKGSSGRTPLECLVLSRECTFESFRLLLQSTPDINARRNCLLFLESRSQDEKVQYIQELVSAGVSLESRDSAGRTPLLSSLRYPDLSQALIRCGARTDAICNKGRGILHHYVQSRTDYFPVERLRALVESGMDPRVVDNEGSTLLHLAVMSYNGGSSSVQLIHQLLDYGISVNVQDKEGRTPLHKFIPGGFRHNNNKGEELVSLLELFRSSGNLNINLQDSEGLTFLHGKPSVRETRLDRLLDFLNISTSSLIILRPLKRYLIPAFASRIKLTEISSGFALE